MLTVIIIFQSTFSRVNANIREWSAFFRFRLTQPNTLTVWTVLNMLFWMKYDRALNGKLLPLNFYIFRWCVDRRLFIRRQKFFSLFNICVSTHIVYTSMHERTIAELTSSTTFFFPPGDTCESFSFIKINKFKLNENGNLCEWASPREFRFGFVFSWISISKFQSVFVSRVYG